MLASVFPRADRDEDAARQRVTDLPARAGRPMIARVAAAMLIGLLAGGLLAAREMPTIAAGIPRDGGAETIARIEAAWNAARHSRAP